MTQAAGASYFTNPGPARVEPVLVPPLRLEGRLEIPPGSKAVIAFAHGSGSSRHSPRNRQVAESLHRAGLATLLFDLLTEKEAADRRHVFDIPLLTERLRAAIDLLGSHPATAGLPLGLFGASSGGAAALTAAARQAERVGAVVVRGGRPDLAGDALPQLRTPTLLIVGSEDREVLRLNEEAMARMKGCPTDLKVVPGATHLFEEPGALELVASLAVGWFLRWLPDPSGKA